MPKRKGRYTPLRTATTNRTALYRPTFTWQQWRQPVNSAHTNRAS